MKPEDIKIDPELRDYLTPLSEEEEKQLTGALIYEGCLSPLIVEANTGVLLDGHNRYRICKEHKIPFQIKTIQITKKSRQIEFVITNQLSRRNLSKDAFAKLVGDLYNMMKTRSADSPGFKVGHEFEGNRHTKGDNLVGGQIDHQPETKKTAAQRVAEMTNTSERTARREGRLNEKIKKHNIPPGTPRKKAKEIIKEKEAPKISAAAQAEEEEVLSLPENQHIKQDSNLERKAAEEPKQNDMKRIKLLIAKIKKMNLSSDEKQFLIAELEVI